MADRATEYLSKELEAKIEIDRLDLQLFNKVSLKNVYIEDRNRDTLIYATEAIAYFDIRQILRGRFVISAVDAEDALFQFHRLEGQKDYNLIAILKYFQPKKKRDKKPKFQLAINHISGRKLRFHLLDEVVGTEIDVYSPEAYLHSRNSNLIGQMAEIDSVYTKDAKVKIRVYNGTPLPDSLLSQNPNFVRPNWLVSADKIQLDNLDFHLLNEKLGVRPELPLDFNDLQLKNAQITVENLDLRDYAVRASVRSFSATENRGFEIKSFYGDLMASSTSAYVKNFELQTPNSTVGSEVEFEYEKFPDFLDFIHKVKIIASVNNSKVNVKDIMAFAAPLNKIPFFISNQDKELYIDCYFEGKVDSFAVKDIVMNMNSTHLEGHMSMKPFERYMTFEIQELQTQYKDVQSLLSFVKVPVQMANMGKMNFYGTFDGYLDNDFKTKGILYTDIGQSRVDLKMNPRGGAANVKYDGQLTIKDFNLGKLLDNKDFGMVDAYMDIDGKGLNLEGLDADVKTSRINYFEMRGYRYDTINLNGTFNQKKFVGTVFSKDPNFNLYLNGELNFNLSRPVLDLRGNIAKLNFCELNFLTDDLILSIADVDMRLRGYKIDDFSGRMRLKNINFHRGWGDYHIDSLFLGSRDSVNSDGDISRIIRLRSDIVSGSIVGHYDIVNLPKSLRAFAEKYYPNFIRNVDLATTDSTEFSNITDTVIVAADSLPNQDMHVNLILHDSKNLTEIIHHNFKYVKGAALNFDYDSKTEKFAVNFKVDSIKYDGFKIENESLIGSGERNIIDFENSLTHLQLNDSTNLPTPYIHLGGRGDSVAFNVFVNEIGKFASNISLNGDFMFDRQSFQARLHNSNLNVLDQDWFVKGDNFIAFNLLKKTLLVHNLILEDSASLQKIALYSHGNKGLRLNIDSFDLKRIYEPVKLPMFDITGRLNARAKVEDVFKMQNLSANLFFEQLIINNDDWKSARLEVSAKSLKDTISGNLYHFGPLVDRLDASFFFIPAAATKKVEFKNYVNVDFNVYSAKAKILEYFMVGQLTNTLGLADAKGRIFGKAPKLNIEGLGTIKKMETTFNFLNTRYYIDTAAIILSNNGMIFSPSLEFDNENSNEVKNGIVIRDQEGNKGYIGGRITHKYLKEWGIDLDLVFKNNLTLNTTAESNMPFYGKVWATGRANISGPFTKMTMVIDAETNRGPNKEQSILVLPIMKPVEVNQAIDFLVFKDMKLIDTITDKKFKTVSGGIEVLMKIKATPDAMARIIIDEQAGDVIEGSGSGNLQLNYTPSGELFLNGDYEIESGSYLFTYKNVINKPFKVEKGGTIRWNGDPYNAEVDLKAKYVQKSKLYNLLISYQEELQNEDTRNEANKPVDVEVLMNMTGSLMRPDIKFGLNIVGNVDGRAGTLANLALRAIQQDETKLNRQVFGLIALNQFLPEENAAANLNLGASSFNTLSEMVSQQFSRYLGDLLSEVLPEDNVLGLNAIDVQVGYKMEDDVTAVNGTGSQIDYSIDNYFLDNRILVHIGGNIDLSNNSQSDINQNYYGVDVVFEFSLTKSGKTKLKIYNKNENSLFGQRNRAGLGLTYQVEFDEFYNAQKMKKTRDDIKKFFNKLFKKQEKAILREEEELIQ